MYFGLWRCVDGVLSVWFVLSQTVVLDNGARTRVGLSKAKRTKRSWITELEEFGCLTPIGGSQRNG